MTAAAFLERLDGLRQTGQDRWIARCPAHEDRRPSLSVRALADGRVLVHCFGGCDVESVVASAGIELRDLMPERIGDNVRRERRRFDALTALRCCADDCLLASIIIRDTELGKPIDDERRVELFNIAGRLASAIDMVSGR